MNPTNIATGLAIAVFLVTAVVAIKKPIRAPYTLIWNAAPSNVVYQVETSSDLAHWQLLGETTQTNFPIQPTNTRAFFRLRIRP